jgi:hypothetical protein
MVTTCVAACVAGATRAPFQHQTSLQRLLDKREELLF